MKEMVSLKKILIGLTALIIAVFIYTFFFTGTKTQPSGITIDQINEMYHTSFPDTIETTSIGEQVAKALFDKKVPVHVVVLVTGDYYCEFEMTKGENTFSSPKSEYLKYEFEINVDDILIKARQYDYDALNTEDSYKPTYILIFDHQDTAFYVKISPMSDSLFTYEQDEAIKPEELGLLEDLIHENILGI